MANSSRTATLTATLIDDVSKPARTVAAALKQAEAEVRNVAKAMSATGASDRLVASLAKLKASKADVEAVSQAWRDYARSQNLASDASQWTKTQAAEVAAWERQTLASVRAVTAERRAEARAQAQLINQERTQMRARQAEAVALRKQWLGGAGGSLAATMGAAAIGGGMVHATKAAVLSGSELASEQAKLMAAGIPAREIAAALAQASTLTAAFPNVRIQDALETYKEIRSVLLSPDEAPKMLPSVIAARAALNAIDRSGEMAGGLQFAVKGAEVLGLAQSQEKFKDYLDAFIRAQQVMGKTITPEQMFEVAKYLKASGPGLSDRFKLTTAVSLAQELGGQTTGQAVDQFVKQLVGGFQGQQHAAAKEFVRLGLASSEDFLTTKTGEIKGMKPGRKLPSAALAATDPDVWVSTVLLPALAKAKITTTADQIAEVRRLFPAGRAADLVTKLITQAPSYAEHAKLYGAAQGLGAQAAYAKDPLAAMNSLTTSISNFAAAVTGPAMPKAAEILSSLASSIGGFADQLQGLAKAHPDLAPWVSGGAIAGGLGVGGLGLYGAFSGLMGGFGLKGSAAALTEAAGALDAAALKLGAASVAEGAGGAAAAAGGAAAGGGVLGALVEGAIPGAVAAAAAGLAYWVTHPEQVRKMVGGGGPTLGPDNDWRQREIQPALKPGGSFHIISKGVDITNAWVPSRGATAAPGAQAASEAAQIDAFIAKQRVDTTEIDQAKGKLNELHDAAAQPATATVTVDTSAIDAAIAKASALARALRDLSAAASIRVPSLPSLGSTQRSNFLLWRRQRRVKNLAPLPISTIATLGAGRKAGKVAGG